VEQGPALRRPTGHQLVALACALAAAASAAAAVVASLDKQGWDRTALVRMHDTLPLAKLALHDDPGFRLRHGSGFYDGAFFYAIARDPLATGRAHRLIPEQSYHFGHPAYGWLAWLASAGGRPNDVPEGLLLVGMAAMALAGGAASLLARLLGWTPWGGLAVALNPGLVFSVANDTSEPLGAALLLLGLAAHLSGRRGWAFGLLAALCLVKEPLALVPLALAAWELWTRRRAPLLAAAVVPAALWWLYLRIHLGALPFGQGSERLTFPFLGWGKALLGASSQSWDPGVDTAQLGQAAVPLIVVVWVAILVAAVYALRLRSGVDAAYLVVAALYACITANGVQYPKDLVRELAVVLTLLPLVLAARPAPYERPFAYTGLPARPPSGPRRGS
ncbi:MAG: hypothetical protein V7644_1051, partial [Actinomycetota bacterium]